MPDWAQPPVIRSRRLLTDHYRNMLTQMELHPYEIWVLAETIRMGLEHPQFHTINAGYDYPDVRELAKQLWAECRDRLTELDPQIGQGLSQPR